MTTTRQVGEIPAGYRQKTAGRIAPGDLVWAPKFGKFSEPDMGITGTDKVRDYRLVITPTTKEQS